MNSIEIFKNESFGEVRVAGTSEKPLFCLADICRILELQVGATKNRLDQKGISLINTLTKGGMQELVFVNEKNLYKVIMRSDKPQAETFQDWVCGDVLPSIRKTGNYTIGKSINPTPTKIKASLEWVKGVKEILNLNDSSTLTMLKQVAEPLNLPLPDYTPSKGQLLSAKALLEQNGIDLSSQQFNQKMMEKGFMIELSRPSSKGTTKHFKSLTSKASNYGENQVNPGNPKETQPLYYVDKFTGLLNVLGIA